MDIDDDEKDSWFSYLGENKFQFKLFNDCLMNIIRKSRHFSDVDVRI